MSIRSRVSKFFESLIGPFLLVMVLMLVIVVPLVLYFSKKRHTELMRQCINDGNKEYVCEAMLTRCEKDGGGPGNFLLPGN